MFTGIVETTAEVIKLAPVAAGAKARLTLASPRIFADHIKLGDSIAVNGCCLTICTFDPSALHFDMSSETLKTTSLGSLKVGDLVNLERALLASSRLDGHLVTGHVDGLATVAKLQEQAGGWVFQVDLPKNYALQVVKKGSICLDGVSLTVNEVSDLASSCRVEAMLIPTTLQLTNLSRRHPGDRVNFESDIIGKYLERYSQLALTR